mmetsp:Transcript_14706/g.21349  ORF Transcript_14706/g.21349 Transcript_14706/m.21349 type:complete len:83 (+) Transcript_14706:520-768(+)
MFLKMSVVIAQETKLQLKRALHHANRYADTVKNAMMETFASAVTEIHMKLETGRKCLQRKRCTRSKMQQIDVVMWKGTQVLF